MAWYLALEFNIFLKPSMRKLPPNCNQHILGQRNRNKNMEKRWTKKKQTCAFPGARITSWSQALGPVRTVTIRATFVVCAKQAKFLGGPWASSGSSITGFVLYVFLAHAQTVIWIQFASLIHFLNEFVL